MKTESKLILSETSPTPIVKDFITFAKYVENHQILLTKSQRWLPRKDLLAINALMTGPEQEVTSYSDQNAYPLLNLFYHLALAARLFRTAPGQGGKDMLLPTDRLTLFYDLNPAEKYISLLEALWIDADWDVMTGGMSRYGPTLAVGLVFEELKQFPPGQPIHKLNGENVSGLLWNWGYFVHYFRYFGFWETTKDEQKTASYGKKFYYFVKSITLTPMFHLLCTELIRSRDLEYWNLACRRDAGDWLLVPGELLPGDEDADDEDFDEEFEEFDDEDFDDEEYDDEEMESFAEAFIPLFPEGELTRWLPRQISAFFSGTYVLKVAVRNNCWRRIRLSSHCTLYDLHLAIQQAFEFADDHLYAFFMDGKRWSRKHAFYSPNDIDTPVVTEARLGELNLSVGQTFLYLFDFGDEWEFAVTVENAEPIDTRQTKPQVIETKGEAPEQYGDWD